MKVLLTFDYELFFGSSSGSVEKCLLFPTEKLLSISEKLGVKMTFFLDAGFLRKLNEEAENHASLMKDLENIKNQISSIVSSGNDVQFHVHPHWECSFYDKNKWQLFTDGCYKLSDFSEEKASEILHNYHTSFCEFTGQKPSAFRAGGWCVQPFNHIAEALFSLGIRYDSSVMPGVNFASSHYFFDYRNAPQKSIYSFEDDVCKEVFNGAFFELPISSMKYTPFFHWRLYMLGRLFPSRHKMLGDGQFISQPGRKKRSLFQTTMNHVSTDGYYASMLNKYVKKVKNDEEYTVVIGHPKCMTVFSFEKLEQFIATNRNHIEFITFRELP